MKNAAVVWWLRIVGIFVLLTLLVGGVTRITDSGLSITEWDPILGVVPPLSHQGWEAAFALYREIPEYRLVNEGMSLAAFQSIYLWEWAHRLVARTIGLVFLLPFVAFWLAGRLPGWFKPWGIGLLCLGGLQGVVGWWMVTSGLSDRVDVSHYRLAVHLLLACSILALTIYLSERLAGRQGSLQAPRSMRITGRILPLAILFQIGLGALVAGLDAGLAADTWPLMGGRIVPEGLMALSPAWLNGFENPLAVQFNHRLAGYALAFLVLAHAVLAGRAATGQRLASMMLAVVLAQIAIGVLVVVSHVPPVLAGTHQVVAAILLWMAVVQATRLAPRPAAARLSAGPKPEPTPAR